MNPFPDRCIARRASHAGSWYTADSTKLGHQLSNWLSHAEPTRNPSRAIITPHAGYDYSGPCAAFAFKQINPNSTKRIFILGPSHHVLLHGKCALSSATVYKTPLFDLDLDKGIYKELHHCGEFVKLRMEHDEEEHSLEMQLPYIAQVMDGFSFTIIPIIVGSLSPDDEARYGRLLAPYLGNPENVFVISSDFCHWGRRFQYTYYDKQRGAIWQSIESLDKEGMQIIERLDPAEFNAYIRRSGNTICGRYPIGILLNAVQQLRSQSPTPIDCDFKFVQYAQSEKCQTMADSSVSYAAGSLTIR